MADTKPTTDDWALLRETLLDPEMLGLIVILEPPDVAKKALGLALALARSCWRSVRGDVCNSSPKNTATVVRPHDWAMTIP